MIAVFNQYRCNYQVKRDHSHGRNQQNMKKTATAHRFVSGILALIAGLFLFTIPAFGYEEDTHFLMTYVICRSVGFTDEESLMVAAVNQGMDDSKSVNAHDGGIPQVEEEWRWHALDKGGDMGAKGVVMRRDFLFKEALNDTDARNRLIRLGIFFHYQQDTWAHRHHEKKNHLSRDGFTTFNTPTGHGPWGSKPDRPPLDPVAAFMSLEDGVLFASEFLEKSLGRKPISFFDGYQRSAASINKKWNDKRKGKYFNQIDVSTETPGSPGLYLRSLIAAQIDVYTRSRDANPFYAPRKTPDLADFAAVRGGLQAVCDQFSEQLGTIIIPGKDEKLEQGFTSMTTEELLSLDDRAKDRK
jgi:hypothetical protein